MPILAGALAHRRTAASFGVAAFLALAEVCATTKDGKRSHISGYPCEAAYEPGSGLGLRIDHDLHAPVGGAPIRRVVRRDRTFFADPCGLDAARRDALTDQIAAHLARPEQTELVILIR